MNIKLYLLSFLTILFWVGCSDDKDSRAFEPAAVIAIQIDGALYNIINDDKNVIVDETNKILTLNIIPGIDLSNVTTSLFVVNGTAANFVNNTEHDLRFPLDLAINSHEGNSVTWKVIIKSPPKMLRMTVEDASINTAKTFISDGFLSVVTQIEEGTDLTAQKTHFDVKNGTMKNYVNGTAVDYTEPFSLQILGTDETTVYTYRVVFTTEKVGPATIREIVINGIPTDSIQVENNVVQPFVPYLDNFSAVDIEIKAGYMNEIVGGSLLENVNMYEGRKVKIKGVDGTTTEFTIKSPFVQSIPVTKMLHQSLQFGADAGSSVAFSGANILVSSHAMIAGATAQFGINAYDLGGNYVKGLSKNGINFDATAVNGIRKFATDVDGKILGVQLGAGAASDVVLKIFKWNSIDDNNPTALISYSQSSLGLGFAARAGGINVSGSLSGNATITVPIARQQTVLVWKIANGAVVNTTPEMHTYKYATNWYYSVEPFKDKFLTASTAVDPFAGITFVNSSFEEEGRIIAGAMVSDLRAISYKDRDYVAFTIFNGNRHIFRFVDITVLSNPITLMNVQSRSVGNTNGTTDADLAVINGKLHAMFMGTNDGVYVYQLEK